MLLTITTTFRPATDLGHLLRKHPARVHSVGLSFGQARVFYPEAIAARCTAALLLDIDPAGLVHKPRGPGGGTLPRVHECVFRVLALESEPVDPRL